MSPKLSGRIVYLDYMRVFAFMSVLIGHKLEAPLQAFIADGTRHVTLRFFAEMLYPLCVGGAAGVVVFFLTSGYIITHVLQMEAPLEFMIKRFFRIYPLYMVAVILEWCMWHHLNGAPFPSLSVLVPQLLLIGDFFQTPHTLSGVEWTLRIEVMFYVFMAILKALGLFKNQKWMPWVLVGSACVLYLLPQIPGKEVWVHGYFTLYAPFLFMGGLVYLIQTGSANKYACVMSIGFMFVVFLVLISRFHPAWSQNHYALLALIIFLAGWAFGAKLPDGKVLRTTSDLTYSVYLFHNWLWTYLAILVESHGLKSISVNLQVFILLIVFCFMMHKLVELQAIKIGRKVLGVYKRRAQLKTPDNVLVVSQSA
ncbi:acyltransferase family protein [Pseudomonas sp. 22105]|uniref:acyltransferase family protein n=1 Tax=Pseudomonas TaxID=286 RepID=UPI000D256420|nr:acyltransferase [Pseudomonas glycinae]AWA40733.1 acyltransferase [Pseudomonas fluorescens]